MKIAILFGVRFATLKTTPSVVFTVNTAHLITVDSLHLQAESIEEKS